MMEGERCPPRSSGRKSREVPAMTSRGEERKKILANFGTEGGTWGGYFLPAREAREQKAKEEIARRVLRIRGKKCNRGGGGGGEG